MLAEEIAEADRDLAQLIAQTAPDLLARHGVGPEIAGQLLITAGDNPTRLRSEASFAALCGVSPLPASSGKTNRHRLNRGGDRAANSALHRVVIVRMKSHEPTRAYVTRRTEQGMSKRDIIRCLKRYVARELLPHIKGAARDDSSGRPRHHRHLGLPLTVGLHPGVAARDLGSRCLTCRLCRDAAVRPPTASLDTSGGCPSD